MTTPTARHPGVRPTVGTRGSEARALVGAASAASLEDAVAIMGTAQLGTALTDDEVRSITAFLHTVTAPSRSASSPSATTGPTRARARVTAAERMRQIVEEAELAEQVGLDVFGVGEHHRADFIVSAPEVVLAAVAARTERIRLTSAVTVLGSDDPIRVFQRFATLDLLSGGRAEVLAGRGSFVESFPLFGYDLEGLRAALRREARPAARRPRRTARAPGAAAPARRSSARRSTRAPCRTRCRCGSAWAGTPESAWRAGTLGLPMALAIIGGLPERFAPFATWHREALRAAGHDPARRRSPSPGHAFLAPTSQEAADVAFPPYAQVMSRIGRERGWPPMTRAQFEAMREPRGSLFVGDPSRWPRS
jgi:alkanesulfonate monooxygenase SsuD/methylene tetrahydromethanopterin reductase-like flavin-dependent oxidoreductase (luciferase family)